MSSIKEIVLEAGSCDGVGMQICGWKLNLQKSLVCLVWLAAFAARAQSNQTVYTDSLQNGWQNWSWAVVNLNNSSPVHAGTASISVTSSNYQALYFHHTAQDSSAFTNISFWISGGTTGGQSVQIQAMRNGVAQTNIILTPLPTNSWRQDTISLASLGVASVSDFDGFWIQVRNSGLAPTLYVDDVTLVGGANLPITNISATINIDVLSNRHAISPLIYGTAFANSSGDLANLNFTLHRSGGNAETRYNWLINAHNRAADYFFESLADSPATPGADADNFVAQSKSGSAEPMLTVPMIGWAPKLGPSRGRLASYSISKYGAQTSQDPYFPDAGNGVLASNTNEITWNDPNDANFPTNSAFQQAWLQHLTNTWGISTNGGVRYYLMDNEHTIWHATHRDIHPAGTTMTEIRDKFFDYAARVKAVDPGALVLGPEEWGWSGYFFSGYDQQWSGAHRDYNPADYPDRGTNGGWDYLPWFLDQLHQRATNTNQRLLDYFTVHCYPQGGESGTDSSTSTQLLRNRSTRSLWDTNYVDASWINSVVKLIPRIRAWAATYYPGTKIGITEYNWGAENHINGATAQADILGIFGRENLDLATRWTTPANSTPTFKSMQMYRNYDGHNSTFGDISVSAITPNPDTVSAFSAVRLSDGALTIMAINKQLSATATTTLVLSNFLAAGTGQVWQLTSANLITRLADVSISGNTVTNTLPPQSISLFVFPAGNPGRLRAGSLNSNVFDFWLDGQAGQKYVIQQGTNFVDWLPVLTNTLTSNSIHIALPASSSIRFYRAQWLP